MVAQSGSAGLCCPYRAAFLRLPARPGSDLSALKITSIFLSVVVVLSWNRSLVHCTPHSCKDGSKNVPERAARVFEELGASLLARCSVRGLNGPGCSDIHGKLRLYKTEKFFTTSITPVKTILLLAWQKVLKWENL